MLISLWANTSKCGNIIYFFHFPPLFGENVLFCFCLFFQYDSMTLVILKTPVIERNISNFNLQQHCQYSPSSKVHFDKLVVLRMKAISLLLIGPPVSQELLLPKCFLLDLLIKTYSTWLSGKLQVGRQDGINSSSQTNWREKKDKWDLDTRWCFCYVPSQLWSSNGAPAIMHTWV